MQEGLLSLLRCPVTRSTLRLKIISTTFKNFKEGKKEVVQEGILFAENDWFYPVIRGIPRLLIESFAEHEAFFRIHLVDYKEKVSVLKHKYAGLINFAKKKNKRTKDTFTQEWRIFDYQKDKTWDADAKDMLKRFFDETAEAVESIHHKLIFDAGCGNGLLDILIAANGATVLAMDFSNSIERAYDQNMELKAFFIQGDVQFPPTAFKEFDIVHCSGVLIHTTNTELSFSCLDPCVKKGGKLSVWLYHPRPDFIHNMFNVIRRFTSKLPVKTQYYLYYISLFPLSYIIKKLKGNKQNRKEMMIDILDWFSPEFRWEHTYEEAVSWYIKRNYRSVKITTLGLFGFNIIGEKN